MGTGYTRNDTSNNIADGNIINASDLDGEFDAVESAFNSSTGHTHDGTAAEGGAITVVGPVQDLVVSATEVKPKTTNTLDLGTSGLLYKDAYLQGNMYFRDTALKIVSSADGQLDIDADVELELVAPTVDIDASTALTVDTASTTFTSTVFNVTGSANITGDLDVDNININGNTIISTDTNGDINLSPNGTGTVVINTDLDVDNININGNTISSTDTNGNITLAPNGTGVVALSSTDLTFGDNDKAIFGAGSDLQIYHDGSHSRIADAGTGDLKIGTSAGAVRITANGVTDDMIVANQGGSVTLSHSGNTKLATTATGVSVTGDAVFADNGKAIFGAGSDLQIYHDGSNSFIDDAGTGNFYIRSNKLYIQKYTGESMAIFTSDGAVDLRYDDSQKLATTATGVDVTGVITTDGMTTSADINFGDNDKAVFGAGSDLQIYHNGLQSFIEDTGTGDLRLASNGSGVLINKGTSENMAKFLTDGAVELYYDQGTYATYKLATTATGIDVTGTAVTDGLTVAGNVSVDGGTIKLDGNYPVGTGNVALGDAALDAATTATGNTAIGGNSLSANNSGNYNTAVGRYSLVFNTTGVYNTGIGYDALFNTTGSNNTALGADALYSNTTASNNTAVGYQALYANTTGQRNTALGHSAGAGNTTNSYSVYIGSYCGDSATGGSNVGIGDTCMRAASGTGNTSVGSDSLNQITSGAYNTCIGYSSGTLLTTGSKNTILGRYNGNQGGLDIRTASNNIVLSDGDGNPRFSCDAVGRFYIRQNGAAPATGTPAALNIRRSDTSRIISTQNGSSDTLQYHHVFLNTSASIVGNIAVNASATAYNTSSDYRLKENVIDLTGAADRVQQLAPKRFNFIADADKTVDGFLAHEVAAIVPEAITGEKDAVDEDGNPEYQGIDQSKIVPLLTAALQEALTKIDALEARIAALESN